MLPGFRFLSVAIVLGVSMLIFGLGAAALLRATHEEFASLPLKQMPEVTFGSREETEQPTLAVLQVDPPNADPAEPEDQAAAQNPPSATTGPQPEFTAIAAIPAPDASSNGTPAPSPAPSNSISTTAAGMAASANANTAELSEPPPSVVASVDADNITKPDITETAVIQTDVIKSDVGVSDVAETMTSPLQSNFRPPLPVSRPAQVANVTPSAAKHPSVDRPSSVAKRNRHRKVVRRSRHSRSVAPNPALLPTSPFD